MTEVTRMTRAEMFRYLAERSGLKREKQPRSETSEAHRAGASHNAAARAAKNALYALEPTSGRASRKSTRKSANRQKTDAKFRMKRQVKEVQH
jgi:hypothetical protein